MQHHFETPTISPAIPSRSIRSQYNLLRTAHKAGIIPQEEWNAISTPENLKLVKSDPESLLKCLKDVPITPRYNNANVHYCVELWRKAKGLNRGRAVLACVLAHLIAMKTFVESDDDKFDVLLEDNVRAPISIPASLLSNQEDGGKEELYCECAEQIWNTIQTSEQWEHESGRQCHLRYYGWLGSIPNLEWLLHHYIPQTSFPANNNNEQNKDGGGGGVFPFPSFVVQINNDNEDATTKKQPEEEKEDTNNDDDKKHNANTAGGTPIWGAYAYSISSTGYQSLIQSLQHDVGAILWKGKRMRCYLVKPIDKILPRRILSTLGDELEEEEQKKGMGVVHVTSEPAFFRAPMLSSKIHPQWDEGFCRSTEYQLDHYGSCGRLDWDDLWLTTEEAEIVAYKKKSSCKGENGNDGIWLTLAQLAELKLKEGGKDGDA